MSATNRGVVRIENDFYETPEWCVHRLLENTKASFIKHIKVVLDPCYGDGAITDALKSFGYNHLHFRGVDIKPKNPVFHASLDLKFEQDFLKTDIGLYSETDCILTNPPFSLAEEIIKHSLKRNIPVIMLLRLNFLGGAKRSRWLRNNMPSWVGVLPNRPVFGFNKKGVLGTDATEYSWMCWDIIEEGYTSVPVITILNETSQKELQKAKERILIKHGQSLHFASSPSNIKVDLNPS